MATGPGGALPPSINTLPEMIVGGKVESVGLVILGGGILPPAEGLLGVPLGVRCATPPSENMTIAVAVRIREREELSFTVCSMPVLLRAPDPAEQSAV